MALCLENILHQIKICITKYEPFCAGGLKIDLNPCMCALAFAVKNYTIAEFSVPHALPESYTHISARRDALRAPEGA